jgi:hypothetical protein
MITMTIAPGLPGSVAIISQVVLLFALGTYIRKQSIYSMLLKMRCNTNFIKFITLLVVQSRGIDVPVVSVDQHAALKVTAGV